MSDSVRIQAAAREFSLHAWDWTNPRGGGVLEPTVDEDDIKAARAIIDAYNAAAADGIQTRRPQETDDGWSIEYDVACVVCPKCAFTFDACHHDGSCPLCDGVQTQTARETTLISLRAARAYIEQNPSPYPAMRDSILAMLDQEIASEDTNTP